MLQIINKGKEVYPILMYVNAWLKKEMQESIYDFLGIEKSAFQPEDSFHEQGWQRTRILNGDERYQIFATAKPHFFRLTLFTIERK